MTLNTETAIDSAPPEVAAPSAPEGGMESVPHLMARIQNREQPAMAELYVLCHAKVLRQVAYLMKDDHAARDVTQDVFLRIWRYASAYDATRSPNVMAWINQVARNQVLTEFARRKRRQETGDEELNNIPDASSESETEARMTAQSPAFQAAMSGLSPSVNKVIKLRFFAEMPLADIATEMEVPLGTVKTWLRRGLAKMKTELETVNLESSDAG
ncbi:RNA polymerase sigma factor [Hydrogenophaga crassostreae]|uniref:RNA polymerase sigma factor n=1 Tax=Hydrogenophaga crassostreae TaxID=1763535 RepID=UPI0012FB2703|nr:RNA polymerase sigma factor [Hydrogenophaga crassostreae]